MEILKEKLKQVKEKLRKIENTNNCRNDKGMKPLSKREKELFEEAIKALWESKKALETETEAKDMNKEKRKRQVES